MNPLMSKPAKRSQGNDLPGTFPAGPQRPGMTIAEPEFSIDHFIMARETGQEMKEKLERSLANLTARQREAIFLRFYEGLSYEEVASVLQITTKATYKIMARALAELREHLALVVSFGILYRSLNW